MPKWTNKGHEFDELGEKFIKNKNILLLGKEEECEKIKKKLDFLGVEIRTITDFITNEKPKLNLLEKLSTRIKTTALFNSNFKGVVIFAGNTINRYALKHIKRKIEEYNILSYADFEFLQKYLSIFAVYVADKVYFKDNSFLCTTICNLNCEYCLNFSPYDKNQQHYDIARLKRDVDIFFNCVDRVGLFHISGGEPFLYSSLAELIAYIYDNYKDKIYEIGVATNGTTIPSDELCETIKRCNVRLEIDDYTRAIPRLKDLVDKIREKLKNFDIEPVVHITDQFVEMFPPRTMYGDLGEEVLRKHYDSCGADFREFKNGKLSDCNYSSFATQAGMIQYNEDDYYDFEKFEPEKKKELVEFRLGYCIRGYAEFCKCCEGLPRINKFTSPGGGQAKGKYEFCEKLRTNLCKG